MKAVGVEQERVRGREEELEWETRENKKEEEEESRESGESQRNNWITQRERERAAGRVCDKWAVYLAFTVNEAGCDDVLSPLSFSLRPLLLEVWSFLARTLSAFRRRNCPFIAKGWDISLSPNGFHSWVSPRLPLSSSFIQHQKDTPSTWPRSRFHPKGNQRLLASHKAPGYRFAPVTWWFSQYVSWSFACVATVAPAFQATWESICGSLKASWLSKQQLGVDHCKQVLL